MIWGLTSNVRSAVEHAISDGHWRLVIGSWQPVICRTNAMISSKLDTPDGVHANLCLAHLLIDLAHHLICWSKHPRLVAPEELLKPGAVGRYRGTLTVRPPCFR
jgi:hypothetical protein